MSKVVLTHRTPKGFAQNYSPLRAISNVLAPPSRMGRMPFTLASTPASTRARATNITEEQLPELIRLLHERGVKGYLTLNTLVFTGELPEVERVIRVAAETGVDAVLVQDLGVARLIRAICPDLPIHASTQMTLTSVEGIEIAKELGVERVVLARELSLDQIAKISSQTDMPLEAFVHGVLCVAYSGQCLTSESLGGRSANRGQCAQACRLPYELVCDGEDVDLGDQKYLLSPQDLAAYQLTPELIDAGVISFKIEGRLKSAEYVANITRHYRRAIDAAFAKQQVEFSRQDVEEMQLSFSRGFSPGWLRGDDHKMLVPAISSAKRGVFLGTVKSAARGRVAVQLACGIAAGDGLVFEGNRADNDEQGGRVFEVWQRGRQLDQPISSGLVELTFQRGAIDFERLWPGQQLWKTDDPKLSARLRKTFTSADPLRRVSLNLRVEASVGQPLRIVGRSPNGAACDVSSASPLEEAKKHPVTADFLRSQLGRLGQTVYELPSLDAAIDGSPMIPLSVLSELRHEMIRQLELSATHAPQRRIASEPVLAALRADCGVRRVSAALGSSASASTDHSKSKIQGGFDTPHSKVLHVLCRTLEQLQTVLAHGERKLAADFQDIREYREAVSIAHEAGADIWLATPRIQKPDETGLFRAVETRSRWPPRAEPRRLVVLRERRGTVRRRLLTQRDQRTDRSVLDGARGKTADSLVRSEPRSTARSGRRMPARMAGGRNSPAYADVPHGALCVLRGPLSGDECHELWPPLRSS